MSRKDQGEAESQERWRDWAEGTHSASRFQIFAALTFFIPLAAYIVTLCPTVPPGDSGEMIAATYTNGVMHPPGFPLYAILAKLFTFLPLESKAARVNLFSAFCHAGSALFIFLSLFRWTKNIYASFSASLFFAFSPLVWLYAVFAEVMALNTLCFTALLYCTVRFWEKTDLKWLYAGAFVFGLGMSNLHTILFFALPVFLASLILAREQTLQIGVIVKSIGFFAIGFLPHLYLPIASAVQSKVSWGDQTNLGGFMTHILRSEYGTFQLAQKDTGEGFALGILSYVQSLGSETLWIGLLIGVFGLYKNLKATSAFRKLTIMWIFAFGFFIVVFHSLANLSVLDEYSEHVVSRMWLLPHALFFAFMGLGLNELSKHLFEKAKGSARLVFSLFAISLVAAQAGLGYRYADRSEYEVFSHYAARMLDSLPENAILFLGDTTKIFPISYMQNVEGYRTDVRVIYRHILNLPWIKDYVATHFPRVTIPGPHYNPLRAPGYNFKALFDSNYDEAPIFVTNFDDETTYEGADESWKADYELRPHGFFNQIVRKEEPFEHDAYITKTHDLSKLNLDFFRPYLHSAIVKQVILEIEDAEHMRARAVIFQSIKEPMDVDGVIKGIGLLEKLAENGQGQVAEYYRVIGSAYQALSKTDAKYRRDMVIAFKKFLRHATIRDRDVAKIRKLVKKYAIK